VESSTLISKMAPQQAASAAILVCALLLAAVLPAYGVTDVGSAAGNEMSSVDFFTILSGPLVAIIKAQGNAAATTVQFIKSVGFEPASESDMADSAAVSAVDNMDIGNARMVEFSYSNNERHGTITVPLLTIVPIPFLRFESIDVELNVKITSMDSTASSSSTSVGVSASVGATYYGVTVSVQASVSHQAKSSATNEVKREYSTRVFVHAVQAECPEGMKKILDKLLAIAVATASAGPTPATS